MTFTAFQRASRPSVTRRRDARTAILKAVYGPSLATANVGNWKGKRDFARRAPPSVRREVIRANWETADWPEITFERICADAGVRYDEL